MAAASLGSASLVLKTNGKGLDDGLSKGQKAADKWAKSVESGIRGTFSAVATAATAAGAALATFAKAGGETIEGMAKQARHAKAINLDVGLFGSIVEESKDLGVAEGAVEAFFNKVASSGKDANAFIYSTADLIANLSTEAEQAAKAEEIFGVKALKLLPILQMGSKGIQEMVRHHQKLGLTLNATTAEKALAAFEQLDEAGDKLKGTWNQLVLSQSGLIVGMSKMTEMMASWANTSANKSALSEFFGWVGKSLGFIADAFNGTISGAIYGISTALRSVGGMSENTFAGIQAQFQKQNKDAFHYTNLLGKEFGGENEKNRVKDPNAFKKPQNSKLVLDDDELVIKEKKEDKEKVEKDNRIKEWNQEIDHMRDAFGRINEDLVKSATGIAHLPEALSRGSQDAVKAMQSADRTHEIVSKGEKLIADKLKELNDLTKKIKETNEKVAEALKGGKVKII